MTDAFADATVDALRSIGVVATYRPQAGSDVDTQVVVDTDLDADGDTVRVAEDIRRLSCLRSDVGVPSAGDQFVIDGTTYTVDDLADEAGDAYLVRVIVR